MDRFNELIKLIEDKYPDEEWLKCYREFQMADCFSILEKVTTYKNALSYLNDNSWRVLKDKAVDGFNAKHKTRGRNQFFNLLNESLAYEFLMRSGVQTVEFIREEKFKTPDLKFSTNSGSFYCEVKTISISDEEIERYVTHDDIEYNKANEELERHEDVAGVSSKNYSVLGESFFEKLSKTIKVAEAQIGIVRPENIIYIIVHFDGCGIFNYWPPRAQYTQVMQYVQPQITQYIEREFPDRQIYLREGLTQGFVHIKPFNA